MENEKEPLDSVLRGLATRARAIAYLMESHDSDILPVLDMGDAWQVIGSILDDLGSEVLEVARVIEEESFTGRRYKKQ